MENIYLIEKQKSASKKKQKKTQVKEVKFRPGTEENDYQIKLKKIIKYVFLFTNMYLTLFLC